MISVIEWLVFDKDNEPEDIVREYLTLDSEGFVKILEWYEGSCFISCSMGHWSDEEGEEIKNITHYAEIPKPTFL